MNGFCVHKDYGIVSFINDSKAMRILETGDVVIFHANDKMKLRPLANDVVVKNGMNKLKLGIEGRGALSWLKFQRPSVGDNFEQVCETIGFLMSKKGILGSKDKDLLTRLKKHVDLELSLIYPNVRGLHEK